MQPGATDLRAELVQARAVAGYGVIVKPTLDNRSQPLAHRGHRPVHTALKRRVDRMQLRPQALGGRLTLDRKRSLPGRPAGVREAQEVERFRLSLTPLGAAFGRKAAEFEQAGFVGVQFQAELDEPPPEFLEATLGVGTVLEAHDGIIRVPDEDHLADSVLLSPLFDPEVQDIVEEYIRQEG
jgi:hypothetical protein